MSLFLGSTAPNFSQKSSVGSIDFYDYLLTGEQVDDQGLQRDDVIFIHK